MHLARFPNGIAVAVVMGMSLASCSSSPSPLSAMPRPTTTADRRTPATHASASTRAPVQALSAQILPAPDGYAVSTSSDVQNGPISMADFDKQRAPGSPSAEALLFVDGYEVTYDTLDTAPTEESVTVDLLRFATPAAATQAMTSSDLAGSLAQYSPKVGSVFDIPGSVTIDTTKPYTDGTFDHYVIASKGVVVMGLELITDQQGPTPAELMGWAIQQRSRI